MLKSGQRILQRIRVQVADNQKVGITTAGRVALDPVCQCSRGIRTCQIAVALTVAKFGVAVGLAGRSFGLEMVDDDRQFGGRCINGESLRKRRAITRIIEP